MITVGAFKAKTHFSQLLVDVLNGKTVMITRHGEEVAMLVPVKAGRKTLSASAQAVDTIRHLRNGVTLGKELTIKEMKAMGRK